MAREKKQVQLRPVDDNIAKPAPVRLKNRETLWKDEEEGEPIRLGLSVEEVAVSRRLTLPAKDEGELRTHQPGIEAIIDTETAAPELLEANWGDASVRRHPVPWGWFVLIGLLVSGGVIWSLTRVTKSTEQAVQIQVATVSSLVNEEKEDQEASRLIDQIDTSLRAFFRATTVDGLARMVRHPQRVVPLMRAYYANRPVYSAGLGTIKIFRPLTLDNHGNFWMTSVELKNNQTHNLIVEILESGEVRIDWETLVCYQPMPWDDFVSQRPAGTSLDFRVYVERDNFYSHEFANAQRWTCFRLTASDSVETLFGYAPAGSALEQSLLKQLEQNPGRPSTLVLRLSIPEAIQSRRGVIIEELLSSRWLYIDPPDSGS